MAYLQIRELLMPTTPKRLTISITNGAVDDIELLRSKLEKRLKQRLSIAQVMKRLTIHALKVEQEIEAKQTNF